MSVVEITMLFVIFVNTAFTLRMKRSLKKAIAAYDRAVKAEFNYGYSMGEEQALNNHKKVLDAYRRLFPNAP